MENNLAVYSSHLPLDAHPKLGNNALLCRALGLKNLRPFFFTKGRPLGFQSRVKISRDELAARLQRAVGGEPKVLPGGPTLCRRIGVVTGGAGGELALAAAEGVGANSAAVVSRNLKMKFSFVRYRHSSAVLEMKLNLLNK